MSVPEHQTQDTYARGVDLVREIANEFGSSPATIRAQLLRPETEIYIGEELWTSKERLFIPYQRAKGQTFSVVGPDRHWRWQFRG